MLDFFRILPLSLHQLPNHLCIRLKLIRFLSALTTKEICELELFITSSLFNNGKRPKIVRALLQHLLLYYPEFDAVGLEEKNVYDAVFPKEEFNKNKLNKLASELVKVLRKFIAVCRISTQSEFNDWLAQIQFFQQRELDTDFFYALGKAQKLLQTTMYKEQEYFFKQFIIEKRTD